MNRVIWEHHDIAGQSVRQAEGSGVVVDQWEETASGAKIEHEDPYPANPTFTGADTDGQYPFLGAVGKPITGCTMYGIPIGDCGWVLARMSSFDRFYLSLNSQSYFYKVVYRGSIGVAIQQTDIGDDNVLRSSIHDTIALLYSVHPTALWSDNASSLQGSLKEKQAGTRPQKSVSDALWEKINNPDKGKELLERLLKQNPARKHWTNKLRMLSKTGLTTVSGMLTRSA